MSHQPPSLPVPLHIGRSLRDLDKRAERGVSTVTNATAGASLVIQLFEAAERAASLHGDQERAYILYLRMLLVFQRVSRMRDFARVNFRHFNELRRATEEVARLADVLAVRYKNEDASRSLNELHSLEAVTRRIFASQLERQSPRGSRSVNRGSSRRNRLCELTVIDAKSLQQLLTSPGAAGSVVVFDLRPADEFAKCRLVHSGGLVNISASDLKPGASHQAIESLVPPHQLAAWRRAATSGGAATTVLVLAWSSSADDSPTESGVEALCSVLAALATPPCLLAGGLQSVAVAVPRLLTDPAYAGPGGHENKDDVAVEIGKGRSLSSPPTAADAESVAVAECSRLSRSSVVASSGVNDAKSASVQSPFSRQQQRSPAAVRSLSHFLEHQRNCSMGNLGSNLLSGFYQDQQADAAPVAYGLTGLRNIGNSCYMNCVLQCLNNTPPLALYFLDGTYRDDVDADNPLGSGGRLAARYAELCTALWWGGHASLSAEELRAALDSRLSSDAFDTGEQQDAQEFLLHLLDGLHEDLNRASRRRRLRRLDGGGGGGGSGNEDADDVADPVLLSERELIARGQLAWTRHLEGSDSIVVDLFQGQFKSTLTCEHCHRASITFDAFMYLSVPVVGDAGCTLDDCLQTFLQPERLTDSSQWFCPRCRQQRDAIKKIDLWRLPPCLLIHLKRFRGVAGGGIRGRKIGSRVDFPLAGLRLRAGSPSDNNYDESSSALYNLYAVCDHYGGSESGHYTASCVNEPLGQWHKFDDDCVTQLASEAVVSRAGYILFYNKQQQRPD